MSKDLWSPLGKNGLKENAILEMMQDRDKLCILMELIKI